MRKRADKKLRKGGVKTVKDVMKILQKEMPELKINEPKEFVFKMSDLMPLWEHAKASKDHRMGYGFDKKAKKVPCLMLVKDAGAYMMSNGMPYMPHPDDKAKGSFVVYAKGCRPEDGHIGGDDFVECVLMPHTMKELIDTKATTVYIKLTETEVKISAK